MKVRVPLGTLDVKGVKNCRTQGEKKVCKAHLCFLNFVFLPRGTIELGRLVPNRAIFGGIKNVNQVLYFVSKYDTIVVSLFLRRKVFYASVF